MSKQNKFTGNENLNNMKKDIYFLKVWNVLRITISFPRYENLLFLEYSPGRRLLVQSQ